MTLLQLGPTSPLATELAALEAIWGGRMTFDAAVTHNIGAAAALARGVSPQILAFEPDAAVLTLGRRAQLPDGGAGLAGTLAQCADRGIGVVHADRGGLATLHMPGQLVLFVALPLPRPGIRTVVRALLGAAQEVARSRGVAAVLRDDHDAGLWVGPAKLASIGLKVAGGAVLHGLSLNVAIDRNLARGLTLCGHSAALYADLGGDPAPSCQLVATELFSALAMPGSLCAL